MTFMVKREGVMLTRKKVLLLLGHRELWEAHEFEWLLSVCMGNVANCTSRSSVRECWHCASGRTDVILYGWLIVFYVVSSPVLEFGPFQKWSFITELVVVLSSVSVAESTWVGSEIFNTDWVIAILLLSKKNERFKLTGAQIWSVRNESSLQQS